MAMASVDEQNMSAAKNSSVLDMIGAAYRRKSQERMAQRASLNGQVAGVGANARAAGAGGSVGVGSVAGASGSQTGVVTPVVNKAGVAVTADPKTSPYDYIEQMYGKQETPEERYQREKKEYRRQNISNMLGLFTGIGNMLVTSGNRYGRAVTTPDFGSAVAEGIATREKKRRENDTLRSNAIAKQRAMDMQQYKAETDRKKAEDAERWKRTEFAYNADKDKKDSEAKKAEMVQKQKNWQAQYDRDTEYKKGMLYAEMIRANKTGSKSSSSVSGGGSDKKTTRFPIDAETAIEMPNHVWKDSPEQVKAIYDEIVASEKSRYENDKNRYDKEKEDLNKDNGIFDSEKKPGWEVEDPFADGSEDLKHEEMRAKINEYVRKHPNIDITKRLIRLSGGDPESPEWEEFFAQHSDPYSKSQNNKDANSLDSVGIKEKKK